jgi:predicted SAM-dependent methyltransferase
MNAVDSRAGVVNAAPAPLTLKQRVGQWLFRHLPITRALFDQLRVEVNVAGIYAENALPAARSRLRALRERRDLLANVACGPQVCAGFVNIDIFRAHPDVVRFDCRRHLPFADRSVRGLKAEHFVEHLDPREDLPAFLAECRRVLAPDGVLRIAVPDAGRYLRAYCDGSREAFAALGVTAWPADLPTRMDLVNHVFHQWSEHRWAYDEETLVDRLRRAGFAQVERAAYRTSRLAALGDADLAVHQAYSLYVEACQDQWPR